MICICGYEHIYRKESKQPSWNTEEKIEEGTQPFQEIIGHFDVKERHAFGYESRKVSLYSCPKCGTVRMES